MEAAQRLFHENGFGSTSLADIAATGKLRKGNFFYHFRTKSELLIAVIDRRFVQSAAQLRRLEADASAPAERIIRFVRSQLEDEGPELQLACSIGALCTELARTCSPALPRAREEFLLYRDWLAKQFAALGHPGQALMQATHLLVRLQGAAILARSLEDPSITARELEGIADWLQDLLDGAANCRR